MCWIYSHTISFPSTPFSLNTAVYSELIVKQWNEVKYCLLDMVNEKRRRLDISMKEMRGGVAEDV